MLENNDNEAKAESAESILEKEKKLQERIDLIYEKRIADDGQREKDKREMNLDDYVEKYCAHLPSKLKEKVQQKIDRLKAKGLSETDLKNEAEAEAKEVHDAYLDNFKMPNKAFEKMIIKDMIRKLFKSKPSISDLKKFFYISWDLNALRGTNNLNGGKHEQGDEYIKIPVRVLKDPAVGALAKKFGLDATMIHESGDEFGCPGESQTIIEGETDGVKGINQVLEVVHDKIFRDEKAKEIINIEDAVVKAHLTKPMRQAIAECSKNNITPVFHAWMSGAVCTLYEALMGDISEKNKINDDDDFDTASDKIMGAWLDGGNLRMKKKKGKDKNGLATSKDPNDRFIASIQNMGEESADAIRELDEEKKITAIMKELDALKDERNILKSRLLTIYESGDIVNNEKEIADNKLATRVKDEQIKEAEDKLSRLKE